MIYKFDKEKLVYVKDVRKVRLYISIGVVSLLTVFFTGRYLKFNTLDSFEKEVMILNLEREKDQFSEAKLIELIKSLNIKHPYIVLAQAKLESGNYKSKIFKQNHNLFGMRQAQVRVNTAKGTSLNHAYYENWRESVYDYAFYQCRYLSNARTEQEYFAALDASYAEASKYSEVLKGIVKRENLQNIFK